MTATTAPVLSAHVRDTIEEILNERGYRSFTLDAEDRLEKLDSQVSAMLQDRSFGRILGGPLWLSGASVVDGTVTATKISVNTLEAVQTSTGSLNVTGNFIAGASYPATGARVVINSTGLAGYSDATTTTFKLNVDGSGEIGTGANKITWTTGGVLAIPAAVISSLTIANVGSGVIGSTFQTNAGTSRIDLSATGIIAYASGTETFRLNGTTGAMTATGSFTVKSAASGARVELSSAGGIVGYNSGGTQTFLLNAATGAGQLGSVGGGFAWDSSGNVSISGSLLVGGTINASSVSVTNLTASNISSGALGNGASGINIGGTNGLTINGTLTLGSGGKIIDADGSYWDQTGIMLISAGAFGDSLQWKVSGTVRASAVCSTTEWGLYWGSGMTQGWATVSADGASLSCGGGPFLTVANGTGVLVSGNAVSGYSLFDTNDDFQAYNKIYPGSSGRQTTYYIDKYASGINIGGMLQVSTGNTINFVSPGTGGSASNWSSFTTANIPDKSAGYFLIQIGGTNYRVPFYANG